jgi:hypothetical protein
MDIDPQTQREVSRRNKRGFYNTPNCNIPLNDREPGTVASVAVEQLRPYQERAANWPMFRVRRDGRDCMCCQLCEQSLWFMSDEEEVRYDYTEEELTALKVAHIRRSHDG